MVIISRTLNSASIGRIFVTFLHLKQLYSRIQGDVRYTEQLLAIEWEKIAMFKTHKMVAMEDEI